LWTTRAMTVVRNGQSLLCRLGDPTGVEFFSAGRPATRAEVELSIDSGLPTLLAMATKEGVRAVESVTLGIAEVRKLLDHHFPRVGGA
ncbi:MAG TPA: hypothetical protein VG433_00485, partial [Pirellulales bacterium]|nr:hypothetical protein [Pirellulales bacterium]